MIKVKNIHKQFGIKHVLCGVNIEVDDGKTLAIIGSSGTGKSVLLKSIVGLVKPDIGAVEIDDVDITKCSPLDLYKTRRKIGYVFQESALFDSLNVFENVAFGLRTLTSLRGDKIVQRVKQCLAMVCLKNIAHLKPSELSGGMKKRVGLARAIAYSPCYILYDEPTAGLDPIMSAIISDLIVNLKETLGVTSIVVTHNIKSAYKIADRIMMLYRGKVIFNGTPEETMRTENKYVRQFIEGSSYGPVISDEIFEAVKI